MTNTLTVPEGQEVRPLRWFAYSQNNSGGWFHIEEDEGIGEVVWIQARNSEEADQRAQGVGLYFDGDGDCYCCGDRWSSKEGWDSGQTEEPATRGGLFRSHVYAHRYDGTFYRVTVNDELEG